MTSGPPPTPTNLRILRGNPGKRPLNENEPKPAKRQRIPSPPDGLGEIGAKEWRRLGPQLTKLGLLTDLDLVAFQMYCSTYERWVTAVKLSNEIPLVTTPGGVVRVNPMTAQANRLHYMLNQSLARFGMDPASRSRIAVDPSDRQDDELADWLFGNVGTSA